MNSNIPTSDILDAAADLLHFRGWRQGPEAMDPDGPYCALGAIGAAAGVPTFSSAFAPSGLAFDLNGCMRAGGGAVSEYLGLMPTGLSLQVPLWNDADRRTAEEVIEVLRATAMVERAREAADSRPTYDTEDQPLPIETGSAA